MSRFDQFVGLSENGKKWIEENVSLLEREIKITNPNSGVVVNFEKTTIQNTGVSKYKYSSMFDHDTPSGSMRSFILKSGEVAHEDVQETPWSSGPMFFTALKNENDDWIKETMWLENDISELAR